MSNNIWKYRLLASALLGTGLIASSPLTAKAQNASGDILGQLEQYSLEEGNSVNQVTNVNQLRDVSPTSWAYEALRSLVDRYGCIVGYPNQTYRGNRALSRYEFAAGLNACLNQIERLIAASEAVLREDIDTLSRLMQEFEAELATLSGRVDNMESRIAFLEDHQFSTTTKLAGEVIIAATGNYGSKNSNQTILGDRVRLEFNTSFTGNDRLVTRLAAGSFGRFKNDYKFEGDLGGGVRGERRLRDLESGTNTQTFNIFEGEDNDVFVDWIAYYKPIKLGRFEIDTYTAARGGIHSDYVPTLNPYFEDFDGGNGALSPFATENPIYRVGGGSGYAAKFDWQPRRGVVKNVDFTVGYLAGNAGDPQEGAGLYNGDYSVLAQINANFADRVDWGVTYVRGFHKGNNPIFGLGTQNNTGIVGTAFANLSKSELIDAAGDDEVAAAFFEDELGDKTTNNIGTQLSWRVNDRVNISGFFTYTEVEVTRTDRDRDIWTYGVGFAFPDAFGLKEGALVGVFAGVQPYLGDTKFDNIIVSNKVPVHVEGFFKYPLTDNISITPGIIFLTNPEQSDESKDQVIGTIRTTFTF